MRRVHRWLSVLFGLLILFVATTGLLSQLGALVNEGGFKAETRERGQRQAAAVAAAVVPAARAHEHDEPAAAPTAAAALPAFACPADMTCRPKRVARPGEWNLGLLHHLHSGEQFGPAGVILSIASGLALLFFAFSGLYMYIQMYRRRSHRHSHPKRLFW
jgi:uncharacterized iron-regulated membrane protein